MCVVHLVAVHWLPAAVLGWWDHAWFRMDQPSTLVSVVVLWLYAIDIEFMDLPKAL